MVVEAPDMRSSATRGFLERIHGHATTDLGLLRRLVLDLLRQEKSPDLGLHRGRFHAALDPACLLKLLKL